MSTHENTNVNRAMTEQIVGVLNQSVNELDELSLQRLKNARITAMSQHLEQRRSVWIPLSAAASVVILLLAPIAWYQYASKATLTADYSAVIQDASIDQQE